MKLSSILAGSALAVVLATTAQAQTLLKGSDTAEILNIARGYGAATLTTNSAGDPEISGKINGISYYVYFMNCTDNENCADLNFYLGFLDLKPSLEKINSWNYDKRFSRAYIDQDGDAGVEMDVDLEHGVSPEFLDDQFSIWNQVVKQFSEHVGYK